MSCLKNAFLTSLKLRLGKLTWWLPLVLLPLLVLTAAGLLPPKDVSAPVTVGVALPETGGEAFRQRLEPRSGTVLTFVFADRNTIERKVMAGRWDCGLILAEDFEEKLDSLDTDRLFTLLVGPGSTVYPLVQETVFACVAELLSPAMAKEYLEETGIGGGDHFLPLSPEERVVVSMTTASGKPLDVVELADSSITAVLRWLVSATLLVWLLLTAADLGRWLDSPAVKRLRPLRPATVLLLPRAMVDTIPALCGGCLALLLLGDGWDGCLSVLAFGLFLSALALLAARCPSLRSALPILMPFLPVVSLLLSPTLVDLSLLYPPLSGIIRWQPVSLFLRGCGGRPAALIPLAAAAAACLLLSLLLDHISKKKCAVR